jgi:hypothetical protein
MDFTFRGTGTNPGPILTANTATGAQMKAFASILMDENLAAALSSLSYRVEITKKTPAPMQNLQDIAGLAFAGHAAVARVPVPTAPQVLAAGEFVAVSHLPSNIAVTAKTTKTEVSGSSKEFEIGKNTFDNEKKYWYDFSLGLPVSNYNEFKYDQAGNQITARTIDKKNVFAFFNAGVKRDTKALQYQIVPTFLYGIPITGQPLKHHIFAGSVGLNWANFFVGVRLDHKPFYTDFTKPLTGENVTNRWRTHLAYGINFPVGTIVGILKKSAK